jgi:uncharacterized protein
VKLLPIVSTTSARGCGSGCSRISARAPGSWASADAGTPAVSEPNQVECQESVSDRSLLSAEVFTIPIDEERFVVYAPLRRAAFVTNAIGINRIADLRDGISASGEPDDALVQLLRKAEMMGAGVEAPPDDLVSGDPMPTSVTLFLTTACNLRCHYCYASAGDTPLSSMSLATARRGIDFVLANAITTGSGSIGVYFHGGGEPTLNWDVLTGAYDYACARAATRGITVSAATATNGVLRDAQVTWIVRNLESASVSFDGLPAVHDAHRPRVGGQPSSAQVLRTLGRFDEAGFSYGVRVTVTADQIPYLPDSVEFIASRFAPRRIQVEPSYQLGRWVQSPSAETSEFINAYREAQLRADHHGVELYYSAARLGLLTNHFCGVTQDTFALSPDGNVSACYEVFSERQPFAGTFFWASPGSGGSYDFDRPALEKLRGQATRHHDFCSGCFAKWSCAGDCYHKALSVSSDAAFQGSDRCHITRELTKDQILRAIVASGGLLWHAGSDAPSDRGERL